MCVGVVRVRVDRAHLVAGARGVPEEPDGDGETVRVVVGGAGGGGSLTRSWGGVRGVELFRRGCGRSRSADSPSKVRSQGGGTQDTPDETLFAAIIYVLVSGCTWRALPPCFGISKSTTHRRFLIRSRAGVWGRLHEAVLHRLDDAGLIDLTRIVLDTAHVRALAEATESKTPFSQKPTQDPQGESRRILNLRLSARPLTDRTGRAEFRERGRK